MAQPRVVTIHYTLTNDQGEQLDSSRVEGREPLSYLEGAQNIIGGLENALNEKSAGDQVKVSVAPAEGYGEVNEELIQPVPRSAFEGVDTIVEVSPLDLGREVSLMKEVSERSGVQFICCTGCWLDVPRSFWGRTPEFVAALWSREIEEGIEGTGIKAGIIKVATSDPISEHEELMLRSAAKTHLHTGVPITTHTPPQSWVGEKQINILKEEGVEPHHIYIGHINNTPDRDYHRELARVGRLAGLGYKQSFRSS